VVLSFIPVCGRCFFCLHGETHLCVRGIPTGRMLDGTSRVRRGGRELSVMQFLGCMAERAVVPAACAVKIEPEVPLVQAALVGCAVATGVGAALRTARVEPGTSVAVFGCGGVGLCIVQGARLAGAARIVAVDVAPGKLELARRLGASDAVDAREDDPVAAVRAITEGIGADYTFEAAGRPELVLQAWSAARRGGVVTVVGLAKLTETVSLNALLLAGDAKTLKGSVYGSANPHADFPTWLRLHALGRLDLGALVTRTYAIEEAPLAFADLERGANARGVIVFD
jgi:S-(hydroxymethyl)glutathione dehydrogenase/alcohol dehydrogenase